MKFSSLLPLLLLTFGFSACAVRGKGILLSVEPATPLDQRDLHKHCDLGDKAACALTGKDLSLLPAPAFPIVQGLAVPYRAVFTAVLPKDSTLFWFIYDRDQGRLWKLHDSRKQMRAPSQLYVQRIEARELESGKNYELLAGDKDGNLLESRSFSTLAVEGNTLRFAVLSGLGAKSLADVAKLHALAAEAKPELIVLTGGNLSTSFPKEKLPEKRFQALDYFFERHLAARATFPIARFRRLIPLVATWSDSEFGLARGDRRFFFRDQAREVFDMFFPVWADETSIVNGPGVAKSFMLAGQKLALLDDRSFRLPPVETEPCTKKELKKNPACGSSQPTLPGYRFGKMQSDWAFRLAVRSAEPVWLISAEPWLGLYQITLPAPATAQDWLAQLEGKPASPLSIPGKAVIVESVAGGNGLRAKVTTLDPQGRADKRELQAP